MSDYYSRAGKPITLADWASRSQFAKYQRVAASQVSPSVYVSTVWLGLNHALGGGPPLIFETMVFRDGEGCECERYSTEAEAEAGHRVMVEEVERGLDLGFVGALARLTTLNGGDS